MQKIGFSLPRLLVTPATVVLGAGMLFAGSMAFAQAAAVGPSNLGGGYAQIINISLSEDVSSARYVINGSEGISDPELQITRFPFRFASVDWAGGALEGEVQFGYLDFETAFLDIPSGGGGEIKSDWAAYGLTIGAIQSWPLTATLNLEPSLRMGAAHLKSDAEYVGSAAALRTDLDGVLFNWSTRAWIVSPGMTVASRLAWGRTRTRLSAHVMHSWIASFDESNQAIAFRESANTFSCRAEMERPTGLTLAQRRAQWTGLAGYARFFGKNSEQMGFNDVFELGAGLSLPLKPSGEEKRRLHLGASILRGEGVRGWTVSLGLRSWQPSFVQSPSEPLFSDISGWISPEPPRQPQHGPDEHPKLLKLRWSRLVPIRHTLSKFSLSCKSA